MYNVKCVLKTLAPLESTFGHRAIAFSPFLSIKIRVISNIDAKRLKIEFVS